MIYGIATAYCDSETELKNYMLIEGEEAVREAGTIISLVGLNPSVLEVIRRSPLWGRLGDERMFLTLDQAVEWFQRQSPDES